MPHVQDEHQAGLAAIVPHLVLEAIVEYKELSLTPGSEKRLW